jgi:hypothetical protein
MQDMKGEFSQKIEILKKKTNLGNEKHNKSSKCR